MHTHTYGREGPWIVVLHGGPGVPGQMAPVARALAEGYRVLEPHQRGSGDEALTVARHVADLDALVELHCEGTRPAMVGSSWGAMLALAYAAAHPGRAGPLVLIGCGTFDPAARDRMRAIIEERMTDDLRRRLERLPKEIPDPDRRLEATGDLILPLYAYDADPSELEGGPCDACAHQETWSDMVRLQEQGHYPAAFAAIESPVLMLHGAFDPHPGAMIRASLEPHLARLEYNEWERCGHYPWAERAVRDEFYAALRSWLSKHLPPAGS
jgi:pimeloyl-ACP methyl ester carboxylesterase